MKVYNTIMFKHSQLSLSFNKIIDKLITDVVQILNCISAEHEW